MAYMDHKYSGGEIVERRRKKKRDDNRSPETTNKRQTFLDVAIAMRERKRPLPEVRC